MKELQPHQQHVVQEQAELQVRINAQCAFQAGDVFKGLPKAERSRLRRQLTAMELYDCVLLERIAAF